MSEKDLQLAEVRLVRLRQEIEQKYGHYDELRRVATGVLQALDLGLVTADVMKNVTEELMITTPKYWLAPCLVALVGWITDQKEVADRALQEALRRNARKTALFFALVCRRYGRWQASKQWFEYYFENINPFALDKEILVLIEGITHGVLGIDIRSAFMDSLKDWVEECREDPNLTSEERSHWKTALYQRVDFPEVTDYPYLKRCSSTWNEINYTAQSVSYFDGIARYYEQVLQANSNFETNIEDAVDKLLEQLVMQYEEGEWDLRTEERKMEVIIEWNGDRTLADKQFAEEKDRFKRKANILELLRQIVIFPEPVGVSTITQRFAIAWSKDLILEAHEDLVSEIRNSIPFDIVIRCPEEVRPFPILYQWSCTTRDGSNVEECTSSLIQAINETKKKHLKRDKRNWQERLVRLISNPALYISKRFIKNFVYIVPAMILLLSNYILLSLMFLIAIPFVKKWIRERPYRKEMNQLKDVLIDQLQGALADVVDYRRYIAQEDRRAERLPELLKPLTVEETLSSQYDKARVIL